MIDQYENIAAINYQQVLDWVQNNLNSQLHNFHRILCDGKLAGFFCLTPLGEVWELDSLFVFPAYQRQGIGTQILRHCVEISGGNLFLYVFRSNTGAIRLYEKIGFRITKEVGKTRCIMQYCKQGC